ncbi:MAG TPA: DNA recombination protein RmuC [Phycisphaerae bacterium]|nr:DNA recombination protein RmuC [Phycisphaerae bacterium]
MDMLGVGIVVILLALPVLAIIVIWTARRTADAQGMQVQELELLVKQSASRVESIEKLLERNQGVSQLLQSSLSEGQKNSTSVLLTQLNQIVDNSTRKLDTMRETIEQRLEVVRKSVEDRLVQIQQDNTKSLEQTRQTVDEKLQGALEGQKNSTNLLLNQLNQSIDTSARKLDTVRETVEQRLEAVRKSVEDRLVQIQQDNTKSLDQMRQTVDEKLQGTLERRLGESFKLVSERLEAVQKGLGEMQTVASSVGDLKKVLQNVKTRGIFGEIQLQCLLEEGLLPEQFIIQASVGNGREKVDAAIRLPGREGGMDQPVLLPIDAKFPMEAFTRLVAAQEAADPVAVDLIGRELENRIELFARDISDKYINPPVTTDFAILFLPTEALFAEITRRPGLMENLQHQYKVVISGPTTLWALLTALRMGFQTLAIQKRTSEVWDLLKSAKTEFSKFGDALDDVRKKIYDAANKMDAVAVRSRAVERTLREVQNLPEAEESIPVEAPVPLPEPSPNPA